MVVALGAEGGCRSGRLMRVLLAGRVRAWTCEGGGRGRGVGAGAGRGEAIEVVEEGGETCVDVPVGVGMWEFVIVVNRVVDVVEVRGDATCS